MLSDVWSLNGRYRTLHLTWFAFFLTFVVWFNLAPLATTVKADLGLSVSQIRTLSRTYLYMQYGRETFQKSLKEFKERDESSQQQDSIHQVCCSVR